MDESRLDSFSHGWARMLFNSYPEWSSYARVSESEEEGYLIVAVPCPNPTVFAGIMQIETEGEEVTVSFDAFHTHFPTFSSADPAEYYRDVLTFVADLLSERTKVVSWWSGENWKGSTTLAAEEPVITPTWVTKAERVRVRSWLGTYDEDRPNR